MATSSWPARLARGYGLLRGAVLAFFAALLAFAPERAVPGSSQEPARRLGLMFSSRTALLGLALLALAVLGRRRALGWLLLGDGALQLFDAGMAVATGQANLVLFPLALAVLDAWAGRALLRAAREG